MGTRKQDVDARKGAVLDGNNDDDDIANRRKR
jgi:hypothetical protein